MPHATPSRTGRLTRLLAVATTAILALVGVAAVEVDARADTTVPTSTAPLLQRSADTATADSLPTVQINDGYVWAQTTIGTTVYAVGRFTNVRPAGAAVDTGLVPRSNVLAYDITTGTLVTGFAPTVNGVVKSVAASPDGTRLYIGGSFDTVNGQTRWNFAVLDARTGQLVSGISPSIGGAGVYALTATGDTVYVGGLFTQANGVARTNLAAFAASTGALMPWAPTADLQVDAMVREPTTGNVVIGGRFYAVNSTVQRGLADLDPVTGALNTAWQASTVVQNGWSTGTDAGSAGIFGLSADAGGVYGTGWVYSNAQVGNLEGVFAAEAGSGAVRWISDCHGDHYGVYSTGSVVYATSHTHQCETVNLWPEQTPRTYRYAEAYTTTANGTLSRTASAGSLYKDWSGTPSPSAYDWFPDFTVGTSTGLGQAGLSITGAAGFVSIGGEFGTVNNLTQQGLTRFSTTPTGGAKQGPRVATASWTPQAVSVNPGTARIALPANWDRDDLTLTYALLRAGSSTPLATQTVTSTWWNQPTVAFVDKDAGAGSTRTYTVTATDADGNSRASSPVTVTIASGTSSPYATAVLDDSPSLFYRLGGSTLDWAGTNTPLFGTGVSTVTPGGIAEPSDSASLFDGSTRGTVSSTSTAPTPQAFSEEVWFRTTTTRGGKLIGYGNARTGSSTSYDRHLYMTNAGTLVFGVYPGSAQTVTSPKAYNDGSWHHAVATLGPDGMVLYVDGSPVASSTQTTSAQTYTGYWRIGGDTLSGWPYAPRSAYFAGTMEDVAIYPSALSARQVLTHYEVGKGQTPPTASFTPTATDLRVSFDASGSGAATGHAIVSWAWDFGDGQSGTGSSPTHTYQAAGTYQVRLTVGDDLGLTGTTTRSVTVLAANVLPSAALTTAIDGLTVGVDGGGSSDPDGTVAGYSWNWGDGTPDTTGVRQTHTYRTAGDHTVTLTVTDDRGGTASATATVTVTAPTYAASDDFSRTVATGWGTADTGGTWSALYGSASAASVGGGSGQITLAAGDTRNMALTAVNTLDSESSVTFSLGAAPSTGSSYVGIVSRQSASADYRVRVWMRNDRTVWLVTQQSGTTLAAVQLSGLTWNAGDVFDLTSRVTGTNPTTISAKVWKDGGVEPSDWQVTTTDSTAGLQKAGYTSLHVARAASATSPSTASFDTFRLTAPGQVVQAPPTASFTANATGLTLALDATASTAQGGASIAASAWDLGDGTTATGPTTTHTFTAAGTYTVTLTVTDSTGLTATTSRSVTLTAPPPAQGPVLASDAFGRTVASGWGTADVGGAWTTRFGAAADTSVTGSSGRIVIAAGQTRLQDLAATPVLDAVIQTTFQPADAPSTGGSYVGLNARRTSGGDSYQVRAWLRSDGTVWLVTQRGGTVLDATAVANTTWKAGDTFTLTAEVSGSPTTTIRARIWKAGTTEPTTWLLTSTDTTAALQQAGTLGVSASRSSSATTTGTYAFTGFTATGPA